MAMLSLQFLTFTNVILKTLNSFSSTSIQRRRRPMGSRRASLARQLPSSWAAQRMSRQHVETSSTQNQENVFSAGAANFWPSQAASGRKTTHIDLLSSLFDQKENGPWVKKVI